MPQRDICIDNLIVKKASSGLPLLTSEFEVVVIKSFILPVIALLARHPPDPLSNHPTFDAICTSVDYLLIRHVNVVDLQLYVNNSIILLTHFHRFSARIHMCVGEVAHSQSPIST